VRIENWHPESTLLLLRADEQHACPYLPCKCNKGRSCWGGGASCCTAAVHSSDPPDPVWRTKIYRKILHNLSFLTKLSSRFTSIDQSMLKSKLSALLQAAICHEMCTHQEVMACQS
jgi:hypothetical protein